MLTSRACEIDAVRNQLVTSFAAARSPAIPAMLLVEPGVAGGEMIAGALQRGVGDAGLRRIAFVVGGLIASTVASIFSSPGEGL
jgi:hypothetical protein